MKQQHPIPLIVGTWFGWELISAWYFYQLEMMQVISGSLLVLAVLLGSVAFNWRGDLRFSPTVSLLATAVIIGALPVVMWPSSGQLPLIILMMQAAFCAFALCHLYSQPAVRRRLALFAVGLMLVPGLVKMLAVEFSWAELVILSGPAVLALLLNRTRPDWFRVLSLIDSHVFDGAKPGAGNAPAAGAHQRVPGIKYCLMIGLRLKSFHDTKVVALDRTAMLGMFDAQLQRYVANGASLQRLSEHKWCLTGLSGSNGADMAAIQEQFRAALADENILSQFDLVIAGDEYDGEKADAEEIFALATKSYQKCAALGLSGVSSFCGEGFFKLHRMADLELAVLDAMKTGRIGFYLQPMFYADNPTVAAFELLLRYEHDEYGAVPPGLVVAAAAKHNCSALLGILGLQAAIENLQRMQGRFSGPARMSINLATEQLLDGTFLAAAEKTLPHWRSAIVFELEQDDLLSMDIAVRKQLNALAVLGFGIAADNVTSDCLSVGLPLDYAKISQWLVTNLEFDETKLERIIAIQKSARRLDTLTASKGVETATLQKMLEKIGIDIIQGFNIARPLPDDQFETWLMDHNNRNAFAHSILQA